MVSSSPWPPIATFIFTQVPSIILTIQLFIQQHLILAILLILLQLIILVTMLKVLTTNPGILPQIVYRCQTDQQLFIVPPKPACQQHKYIMTQHNILHHQKYCGQCHIYRPIRSIHCSACNHCVERYDHHCPWLSICIGKYNYKYFLAYLTSLVLLILISLIIGLTFTILISRRPQTVVKDFVIYMLIGLLAFIFLFPIGRLLIYHIQLIKQGITTNQQIKKTYKLINNKLPYQKLQYSIYREKRLPKFSYRLQKIKKLDIIKYQINQTQYNSVKNSKNSSRNFQNTRDQRSEELDRIQRMERKNVFNSLIKNQHL